MFENCRKSAMFVRSFASAALALAATAASAASAATVRAADGPAPASIPGPTSQPAARTDAYGDPLPPGAVARLGSLRLRSPGTPASAAWFSADGGTLYTVHGPTQLAWDAADGRPLGVVGATRLPDGVTPPAGSAAKARTVVRAAVALKDGTVLAAVAPEGIAIGRPAVVAVGGDDPAAAVPAPWRGFRAVRPVPWEGDPAAFKPGWPMANLDDVAASPDGRLVAAAGEGLWVGPLDGVDPLPRVAVAQYVPGSLSFSADGTSVAAAFGDGTVRVFDPATGKPRAAALVKKDAWPVAAMSPDGAIIAACPPGGELRLWDARTGRPAPDAAGLRPPGEVRRTVVAVAFSPTAAPSGGPLLATRGPDAIHLYDLNARRHVASIDAPGVEKDDRRRLTFSPDGRRLADVGHDTPVFLVDVDRRAPLGGAIGHTRHVVAIVPSADGTTVATVAAPGQYAAGEPVLLWDAATGRPKLPPPPPQRPDPSDPFRDAQYGHTYAAAFATDGSALWLRRGGVSVAYDPATLRALATFEDMINPADGLAVSPDAPLLATIARDRNVVVWDTVAGVAKPVRIGAPELNEVERRSVEVLPKAPRWLAFGPGRRLAVSGPDGVDVWDVAADPPAQLFALAAPPPAVGAPAAAPKPTAANSRVVWSRDGRVIAGPVVGGIAVWDGRTGEFRQLLAGAAAPFALSPGGDLLASVGWPTGTPAPRPGGRLPISVWDVGSGKIAWTLPGHDPRTTALAFMADGRRVASAGADAEVLVWDPAVIAAAAAAPAAEPVPPAVAADLAWWRLDAADPVEGQAAVNALLALPTDVVLAMLRERLPEIPGVRRPGLAVAAIAAVGTPAAKQLLADLAAGAVPGEKKDDAILKREAAAALAWRFPASAAAGRTWPKPPQRMVFSYDPYNPPPPALMPTFKPFVDEGSDQHKLGMANNAIGEGNPSVGPVLARWAEVDVPAARRAAAGVRMSFKLEATLRGIAALGVTEATPALAAAYDDPAADPLLRDAAAQALCLAHATAPTPSIDAELAQLFARIRRDDALTPATRWAAVAALGRVGPLGAATVAEAVESYARDLSAPAADTPNGPDVLVFLDRATDPRLADGIDAAAKAHKGKWPAGLAESVARKIRFNAMPVDDLLARLSDEKTLNSQRWLEVMRVLGERATPEHLPRLLALPGRPAMRARDASGVDREMHVEKMEAAEEVRRRHWRAFLKDGVLTTTPATRPAGG